MKKFLILITALIFVVFSCGCDSKQAYILFNKHPFTQDTMTSTTNVFKSGERVYYLVTIPKPVQTQRLLIQIFKLGKEDRLGYDIVWGKQVKLRDEQIYYYTDYVVFNETGGYLMNVYSKDNPTKILTSNQFYIK